MKTITQYREDIKDLMDKSAALDTRAQGESRDLTEAEISHKNKLLDKVEEITEIVATLERQERLHNALAIPESATRKEAKTVKKDGQDIEVGQDRASRERFGSFGQQLAAVMHASLPGGRTDPRLFNAATGLGETVPSDGGFLVQTDFSNQLLQQVWETAILGSRCQRIPISGNANSIKLNGVDETSRATGSRYGGIRGYWVGEADEKTASKPKFRQIELSLKKLIGLCYATDELLDDAAALEAVIRAGFASEFGFLVDEAIFNGSGVAQPLGILNAGCLVTQDKEAGQDAATIVAENVIKMYARLFARSRPSSVWLVNQMAEQQLMQMSLAVGTGGIPVYLPPGGLSQTPYGMLLGRPVLPIEQAEALGTVGDLVLADLANGYLIAEKGGMKSDMSIHVKFIYDESVFRFVMRIDGQPVRAAALTPFKGGTGATQSHFVALQTRS